LVGTIGSDDERSCRTRDILLGYVHCDLARVRSSMARGDDKFGGISGIWCAECSSVARYAGIDFAVRGIHGEVAHRSLRNALVNRHFGRGIVRGSDDEVSVSVCGRVGGVRQFFCGDIAGRMRVAGWGRLGEGYGDQDNQDGKIGGV
jgi:hypothetical protein